MNSVAVRMLVAVIYDDGGVVRAVLDPGVGPEERQAPSQHFLNEPRCPGLRSQGVHLDHSADPRAIQARGWPFDHFHLFKRGKVDVIEDGDSLGVGNWNPIEVGLVPAAVEVSAVAVTPDGDS